MEVLYIPKIQGLKKYRFKSKDPTVVFTVQDQSLQLALPLNLREPERAKNQKKLWSVEGTVSLMLFCNYWRSCFLVPGCH